MEDALATYVHVSIRLDGERVAHVQVDSASTLNEVLRRVDELGVPTPVADASDWSCSSLVLPFDGTTCGEAPLLTVSQGELTMQSLGWFPSGVLELRTGNASAAPTAATSASKPSELFEAVARRHDAAPSLDVGSPASRVVTTADREKASRKRLAAAAQIDKLRGRKATATNTKLWRMVAKQHATGSSSVRAEDRFYLVVDGDPALYFYCSPLVTAGRALDQILALVPSDLEHPVLVADGVQLDAATPISDQVEAFAVVAVRPRRSALSVVEHKEEAQQLQEQGQGVELDESPPFPIVVKFGGKSHVLKSLSPDSTVADLKAAIQVATGVDSPTQKLVCKAAHLLEGGLDRQLKDTALVPNSTIVLMRRRKDRR